MKAPPAAAAAASRGPRRRPQEQAVMQAQPSSTNTGFPLPTELLLHALNFIQGTHPLRSWRNVAEDLFSLRAASRALRAAVTDAALPRFETALLAAERHRRAGLVPLGAGPAAAADVGSVNTKHKRKRGSPGFYGVHHHHRPVKALMRSAASSSSARSALQPAEHRRRLFLAAAPIVVGGEGATEGEEQVVLCPRGEYDRATDAFLRMPGKLEALSDRDLLALFNRYGAGAAADVRLPPPSPAPLARQRLLPSTPPALAAPERARLIGGIRTRLCPLGYVGLSCRAQRILAAAGRERVAKTEGKAKFGLTEAQVEGPNGIPYLQEGATKLFPVWRLQAAAMRRHGSPAGLDAFLDHKREAAAARRAKLPLVGEGVDDMGWEGVEAAAGAEHDDEEEEW